MYAGITRSRSGHYTVWARLGDVPGGAKLGLAEAQALLARVRVAVAATVLVRSLAQIATRRSIA